ncbi:MAG: acyl-CoA-binding protein [Cytophagia bacterium]|nr:MAG: acyl-CoA-binding protein [Cytophagales bacterium]TAG06762.1 MAG: acyl-CoA-binding protein [Cytophagia bacterium]TAG44314.1 MAG: acyl-CoA-binding protein [Cytophagia bacterium]TAH29374.1 MAG: acyl-CoA-binding protein [Cytophagales bacterium]
MMSLEQQFEEAKIKSKTIATKPSNDILLKIYALFKQSTEGDVKGDKPGFFDMVGQAKYKAWEEQKGKSKEEAQQNYIDLINSLTQ